METLRVLEENDAQRLDIVLAKHEKVSSRSEAQRIIKDGDLTINQSKEKISPKRKVNSGDLIEFEVPPQPPSELLPVKYELDIFYEDDCVIVINKPSGMVVHPSAGHYTDTLVNYLLFHTRLADNDPQRPGIVHRIDKDTSGLLVVAKDSTAQESLSKQFFNHSIERRYDAIVWGVPDLPSGLIEKPIGRHPIDRKKFAPRENGKEATTFWRLLQDYKYLSLIECKLKTGRTHQIRVHMNSIGHPLLGDPVYGRYRNFSSKLSSSTIGLLKGIEGQALHAKTLGFVHPKTDEWLRFQSDMPLEMKKIVEALENEMEE